MKKIMILAAVAMMAMCSQAAKYRWSSSAITNPNGEGLYNGTAMLYCTIGGSDVLVDTYAMSEGAVATHLIDIAPAGMETGTTYNFYYTMTDAETGAVFTSTIKPGKAQATSTTTLGFSNGGSWETVPEPTSGLLLLLGVAGLALRRRRA